MDRLPGPTWLAYLVGIVLLELVSIGAGALEPSMLGDATFAGLYYGALPLATVALIHSLDRTVGGAMNVLRPDLDMDDAEVAVALREMTVAPARPAAAIVLASVALVILSFVSDPVGAGIEGYAPAGVAFLVFWESLIAAIFLVLIYHTVRQLRLIARIHRRVRRIDAFDQSRLYAMSRVTSRTAIGLVLLLAPSLFLLPTDAGASTWIITGSWYAFSVSIAAAAFFAPLWGMHERLVAEKRRLQSEIGGRISTTLALLPEAVDAGDGPVVEARHRALTTLVAARDVVNRVPTWPWSTGALTGFLSAIALPIVLFLIQRLLSQLV